MYGSFLRRSGERRAAATHLAEAERVFCHLAATPFVERCQAELAGCGLAPRSRSTQQGRFALTAQELAVARLVAAGATNREVAAQLVLSVKTIEYNLGNVFTKLSISSRRQLAGRLSAPSSLGAN